MIKKYFNYLLYTIAGFTLIGTLLDTIGNSMSILSRKSGIILILMTSFLWAFFFLYSKFYGINWGETRVRKLKAPINLFFLGLLIAFFIPIIFNSNSVKKSKVFFFENYEDFNVLLLPFESSQNCADENIFCERELQSRFELMKSNDSLLSIEVKILEGVNKKNRATSFSRAKELGDSLSADMVIWGDYQNKCDWDTTKIKVRYTLMNNPIYFIDEKENKVFGSLSDITQIENGVLTGDIEDLIYIVQGLKSHNIDKEPAKTVYFFNKVNKRKKAEYAEIFGFLGMSHLLLGIRYKPIYLDSCIMYLSQAIEIDSTFSGYYLNRGIAFEKKGNDLKAFNDYEKTIALDSTMSLAYRNRGKILGKNGEIQKAINDFFKLIELEPQDSDVYEDLGELYLQQYQLDSSLMYFNKALQLDPKNVSALGNRAQAYFFSNELIKALKDLNKGIDLDPGNPHLFYNRGTFYLETQNIKQAFSDYCKTIELDSSFVSAYQNRAAIYYRLGNIVKSKSDLKKVAELKSKKLIK